MQECLLLKIVDNYNREYFFPFYEKNIKPAWRYNDGGDFYFNKKIYQSYLSIGFMDFNVSEKTKQKIRDFFTEVLKNIVSIKYIQIYYIDSESNKDFFLQEDIFNNYDIIELEKYFLMKDTKFIQCKDFSFSEYFNRFNLMDNFIGYEFFFNVKTMVFKGTDNNFDINIENRWYL